MIVDEKFVYVIDVLGDDADTPEIEGGQKGNTIVFQATPCIRRKYHE